MGQSLIHQQDNRFLTSDGEWHDMPPLFAITGTVEEVKQRLCECIDQFAAAMEEEDGTV